MENQAEFLEMVFIWEPLGDVGCPVLSPPKTPVPVKVYSHPVVSRGMDYFIRISSGIAGAESVAGGLTSLGLLPQEREENHVQLEMTSFVLELAMK